MPPTHETVIDLDQWWHDVFHKPLAFGWLQSCEDWVLNAFGHETRSGRKPAWTADCAPYHRSCKECGAPPGGECERSITVTEESFRSDSSGTVHRKEVKTHQLANDTRKGLVSGCMNCGHIHDTFAGKGHVCPTDKREKFYDTGYPLCLVCSVSPLALPKSLAEDRCDDCRNAGRYLHKEPINTSGTLIVDTIPYPIHKGVELPRTFVSAQIASDVIAASEMAANAINMYQGMLCTKCDTSYHVDEEHNCIVIPKIELQTDLERSRNEEAKRLGYDSYALRQSIATDAGSYTSSEG